MFMLIFTFIAIPRSILILSFIILQSTKRQNKSLNNIGIDLSTARPKWRLDGLALSGLLLYSLVNHAYANRCHHHLVR